MMAIGRIAEVAQRVLDQANLGHVVGNLDGQTLDSLRAMLEAAGHGEVVRQLIEQVEALPPAEAGELDEALEVVGTDAGEAVVIEAEAADAELIEVVPAQGFAEAFSALHETLESVQETLEANADAELEVSAGAGGQGAAIEALATDDEALLVVDSDAPAATDHDAPNDDQADDEADEA